MHATIILDEKTNRVTAVRITDGSVTAVAKAGDRRPVNTFKGALTEIAAMARNLGREITWSVETV